RKFRPTRPGGFSGAKAYIWYVEVLKKRRNAGGRTFCDAIIISRLVDELSHTLKSPYVHSCRF
ncbi:MAG: hypothetical protein LC645_09040, partial [Geobacteraceae bacterium]|nr:hypothetical protein [Geobacteraceae bacterium]